MRLAVEREQDVEHAGQHGRDPVVEADPVGAFQGALELVAVRGQRVAQNGVVLGDDGPHQGLRVGDAGPRLERGVPAARIVERPGGPHVVPEGRAVAHPGLAAIQHPRQIGLDPGRVPKHHVEVDAGGGVDPLVARLPEGIPDLGARCLPGDGGPLGQGQRPVQIHVQVDVRRGVGHAGGQRSAQRHGHDGRVRAIRRRDALRDGQQVISLWLCHCPSGS